MYLWECSIRVHGVVVRSCRREDVQHSLDYSVPYPISYCRQQASLKSVTGESSAWMGWPLNQRLFKLITAFSASSSRRN